MARDSFASKTEYVLSIVGGIIGVGNIWRFPYLCYRYGGGAFLVPYFIFWLLIGMPLFLQESALGQMFGRGAITAWELLDYRAVGVGWGSFVVSIWLDIYYIMIIVWATKYLVDAVFSENLPWMSCGNSFNSECCMIVSQNFTSQNISENCWSENRTRSAGNEYWNEGVLGITGSVYNFGDFGARSGSLIVILFSVWLICFVILCKGVKSSGKAVYVTAIVPYITLIGLVIRGCSLEGAMVGIKFYLDPELSKIWNPDVWLAAGTQVMFSYALCLGALVAMGSYNRYKNDCVRDALMLCTLNSLTSFVAGFAVFSVLGFMATQTGQHIE